MGAGSMTGRETVAAALIAQMRDGACEWDKLSETDREFGLGLADSAFALITLVAAEQGWHMRPDEATMAMLDAADPCPLESYRAMLAVAPKFEWDK